MSRLASAAVLSLTALFTGAALAQQIFVGSSRFNAESAVAAVTVIAMVRELGPVLTALLFIGRAGSSIAAELGLSEITVKIHRGHAMQKMQARSLAELVKMAGVLQLERDGTLRT